MPFEGQEADQQRSGDLARMDVPTCRPSDRAGEVLRRLQQSDFETCVVVNDEWVVMGVVQPKDLEAHAEDTVESRMVLDAKSYRLDSDLETVLNYMEKNQVDTVLATTSFGKLFGLIKKADVQAALQQMQEKKQQAS